MTDYQLVVFDIDGTLYRFEGSDDNTIFRTRFYEEIEQNGRRFIAQKLSIPQDAAEIIRQEIFRKYSGNVSNGLEIEFGLPASEYFQNAWDIDASKYIDPNPLLKAFMEKLSCRKAALTSAPRIWAERALRQLGIDELFDGIWLGDSEVRKPDIRAYVQVLDSLSIEAGKSIMVDDEPKYLLPAKDLGMTTVLVGNTKELFIDYTIREIYEVAAIVGGKK